MRIPPDFSLLIDDRRAAINGRVCMDCWNRHVNRSLQLNGRVRKVDVSGIEQLLAAAKELQMIMESSPASPPPQQDPQLCSPPALSSAPLSVDNS